MARTPYAARTLARQLNERAGRKPDSAVSAGVMEATDDPDGFGVNRTFKFDKTVSKGLADLLNALGDRRISEVSEDKGQVSVTFNSSAVADDRSDFDLDAADAAAVEEEPTDQT